MKKYKLLSLFLSTVIMASCLSCLNLSVFADDPVSDGFIYHIDGDSAVLIGLEVTVSGDVIIPDTLGGAPVVSIEGAFKNKTGITSVSMPDTVKSITKESFYGCSLSSIHFSNALLRIDESAFSSCTNLETVEMPDTLATLGPFSFSWCTSLKTVVFSTGLQYIAEEAFNGCSQLATINIPGNINYIERGAFDGTAYYNTEDNWKDGVLYLGNHIIVAKDSLLPEHCEVMPGTKSITESAFLGCDNLKEIVFPIELKRIGAQAFMNCNNLERVLYCGTVEDRKAITVLKNNLSLEAKNVIWHYEYDVNEGVIDPGDINGDGVVNNKDLTRLFKYHSELPVEVKEVSLDVNGDKNRDNKDITRLFQYLTGWDVNIYSDSTNHNYSPGDSGPVVSF